MKILVTNDDGVRAPGLRVLVSVLEAHGDLVTVVAPAGEHSGASRARVARPDEGGYRLQRQRGWPDTVEAYTLNGSPAACVVAGITHLLAEQKVELCVSGINAGENLGLGLTISGTFGAVVEAAAYGVPGIAISRGMGVGPPDRWDWGGTAAVVDGLLKSTLRAHLPSPGEMFNINVPNNADQTTPVRWTTVCAQSYFLDVFDADSGDITSQIGYESATLRESDDIRVFAEGGLISITHLSTKTGGALSHHQPAL